MTHKRRVGTENSATRAVILDAAEKLMLDEGYAAVSIRRVAVEAGLKHTLIHYYFPTTDDLLLAVYRRAVEGTLERLNEALASGAPLRAYWEHAADSSRTALAIEFMALANHRKVIRKEIAAHSKRIRELHAAALSALLYPQLIDPKVLSPLGLSVLAVGVARILVMEAGLGISLGHQEARSFVDRFVSLHESRKPQPTRKAVPSRNR